MTYTPLSKLTPEFLGPDADGADLAAYIRAVRRVMDSQEFDRDEEAASEYVWNDGSIRFDAGTCVYCEHVQPDVSAVPRSGDDEAWAAVALGHENDCEWIETRAHSLT